jgi:uncharacterized membrane protein YqhA
MADDERETAPLLNAQPRDEPLVVRLFSSSRNFAVFAVFGAFLAAVALYVYGTLVVVRLIWNAITEHQITIEGVKLLQVAFIQMTGIYLFGTVLFIVAFGLYQLFIRPDLPVPPWLKITRLGQLTEHLIEVVGVLLAVTFLAFAVERMQEANMLEFGGAVAIVIAALSLLLAVSHRRPPNHGDG